MASCFCKTSPFPSDLVVLRAGVRARRMSASLQSTRAQTALSMAEPRFHVAPASGWINDPNGPLHRDGVTHIFYQHVESKTHWDWGLVWGHARSKDGVRWEHLPVALKPTPRAADTSGCWSGCVVADRAGQAHALYTGVRLKGAAYDGPTTDMYSATEPMIESIMVSGCESGGDMVKWGPGKVCIAEPPPRFMHFAGPGCLEGWRDPFVITTLQSGTTYRMIVGAGYSCDGKKNGCVLQYSATDVAGPWQYDGIVAQGDWLHGRVWECPALVQIPPVDKPTLFETAVRRDASNPRDCVVTFRGPGEGGSSHGLHVLLIGAYESVQQQSGWQFDPVMSYLGAYDGQTFTAEARVSQGERVDIGDAPYAANVHIDGQGRAILWLWLRDPQPTKPPGASVCGCLALPRVISYADDHTLQNLQHSKTPSPVLFQQPLPELSSLRKEQLWTIGQQDVLEGVREHLTHLPHTHCNVQATLHRSSSTLSGIILEYAHAAQCLVVWVDWVADEWGWLKAEQEAVVNSDGRAAWEQVAAAHMHGRLAVRIGDPSPGGGDQITMSMFIDGTAVEIFSSSGKAASTRMYWDPDQTEGSVQLSALSLGGTSTITGTAWGMDSIWKSFDS